ncbi:Wzz/FepE/Etk N-terminal domain-containing protein [Dyadobacter luticola]|uniref:Lipopolysaccharide biosynthesis protein n=1 Tax=Dyadobacter luticola TaxID=1979387 RepID=A0A5R9KXB1_9BACT|nr:Wzz/FepE/Etk N-terminal domain-containing protein [Dyadobacter luticola]TLV00785.1 lipopolysaccharide biosynthesis protein [Dyadobacter luticola]
MEITVKDLLIFLKKYIFLLIAVPACFAVLGILYSFSLPKLFTAQTVLLPEYSMAGNNSFFSMAVTADRGGAEKLVPELYPNILTSTPFGLYLLKQPITDQNGKKYADLKAYLSRDTSPSLYARFMSLFRPKSAPAKSQVSFPKSNIIFLSPEEQGKVSNAIGLVRISVDNKNGIITIGCEMEDPVIAAIIVEASKNYLIDYVEDYRTSKTSDQAAFLQKRVVEAKSRQQNAEYALQSYRDRNRNSFLNVARIEEQRLQSDYTLAQSIYSDLVVKLEQSKIKVKEERPVFKILEPAKVPLARSSPKRIVIALIFAVVGGFLTLIYIVFFKEKYHLKLM